MTSADSILEQSKFADSLRVTRRAESARLVGPDISSRTCRLHINQIVKQIEPAKVRWIVGDVFDDLLRLLERLQPVAGQLQKVDKAEETFALFHHIHDAASTLVKSISEEALTCEALSEDLFDTLDGITFAVSHDLERVFETKLPEAVEENTGRVVVGKLFRAHDMLTNCLQQATISLAKVFEPELGATKLFGNSDMHYRQSIQLCGDLTTLLNLVKACGETRAEPAFTNLTAGIEKFRNDGMECLRYSDCPQFEGFCEKIQLATTQEELQPVLHQFLCYVETLLSQVKMRAVLANEFPLELERVDLEQLPSPGRNSTAQSYSRKDFEEDSANEDSYLIAV